MLLRSSSTPILKTYACQLSTSESDLGGQKVSSTRPVSLSLERTSSEGELKLLSIVKEKMLSRSPARSPVVFKETASVALAGIEEEEKIVSDGGGLGDGGGASGGNGGDGFWNLGHGHGPSENDQMDKYYQSMIETYPGDALLLANYAKFLKEVQGDTVKAEELCERAILANARDGNVLSMYGDLIWNNHKDGARALTYFDQAVQSSPDDCYVLASYARFLWDADEEEENNEERELQFSNLSKRAPSHNLSQGQGYNHLATAS